ncbi:MAG: phosphoenolpyruvate--protein phosphotransferase [Synergistaceae bacterium]|jgi:phosphotransferase system enzyme I (PtsI)|nr:phosphoenolpyruvate--protein phosphotransferase [Synergistaceae bacterium]
MKLFGNPVSRGIVIGEVMRYEPFKAVPSSSRIGEAEVDASLELYDKAIGMAMAELEETRSGLAERAPDKAKILAAHAEMLSDPVINDEVRRAVRSDLIPADAALAMVFDKYSDLLGKSKNAAMRERASDLQDVKNRILRCWAGRREKNLSLLDRPVIVVCGDLYPSDTVSLDRNNVLGIIARTGGSTSHTAIIARGYEIPAVLGVPDCMERLNDGDIVVLDAENGEVVIAPDDEERAACEVRASQVVTELREMEQWRCVKPVTRDGRRIWVGMNIADINDEELEHAAYSDGSGLFRTEFVHICRAGMPSEDEQYRIYRRALEAFGGKPVLMRTVDIGGDKQMERFGLPKEDNPFLGLRGLRLCFAQPELFAAQIRAALRASVHGDLRIMLPMVGSMEEIERAGAFITEQGALLDARGMDWNREVEIGIMIEIPSMALIADMAARKVDFASIGTNDLCQYLNAADRLNSAVESCYQEYHPAMFRIIGNVARAFAAAGKSVSICGEMAGDPLAIPALIGLGIEKLSMNAASIAQAKRVICGLDMSAVSELAREVQNLETASEVRELLQSFAASRAKRGGKAQA